MFQLSINIEFSNTMADTMTQYDAYFESVFYKNMPYKLLCLFFLKKT